MAPIPPLHQLSFPEAERIGSVAFSPDGSVLYIHLHQKVLDVWAMLVYHWPEIATTLLAIAAAALLAILIRTLRRPRSRGEPYCRRCNYHLTGLPAKAEHCPECGRSLAAKPAIVGRGHWRRTAPLLAGLTLVATAIAATWLTNPPRTGTISGWFAWQSRWLYEQWPQSRWIGACDLILCVDPATGSKLRTLTRQPSITFSGPTLAPDGQSLFLIARSGSLRQISTSTGQLIRESGFGNRSGLHWPEIIGVSEDTAKVWAAYVDNSTATVRVLEWTLATGQHEAIAELQARPVPDSGPKLTLHWPPSFQLISPDGPVFLTFGTPFDPYPLTLHLPGEPGRAIGPPGLERDLIRPVLSPDGRRLYLHTESLAAQPPIAIDLASGEVTGSLTLPPGVQSVIGSSRGGDRFIAQTRGGLAIWRYADPSTSWRLAAPRQVNLHPWSGLACHGRWLAVVAVAQTDHSQTFVVIYGVAESVR